MTDLTVDMLRQPGGMILTRSDGETFFLLPHASGGATLYRGAYTTQPEGPGVVHFAQQLMDKVGHAKRWVLAYPDEPENDE
jgi:hypothetical protein